MNPVEERPVIPAGGIRGPGSEFMTSLVQVLLRMFSVSGYRLNRVLPNDGTEPMTGPLPLATYLDGPPDTKPAAADFEGTIIYVSDGGAGHLFRGSNGAAWVDLD